MKGRVMCFLRFPIAVYLNFIGRSWAGFREVPMGRINRANLKKTIYYLRRNGIMKTWYAVRERAEEKSRPSYAWMPPSEAELEEQRCR